MAVQVRPVRRVLVGDCLDLMAQMPPGSVKAVVTDPPYELDRGYARIARARIARAEAIVRHAA